MRWSSAFDGGLRIIAGHQHQLPAQQARLGAVHVGTT
jgi:hypothetical protein